MVRTTYGSAEEEMVHDMDNWPETRTLRMDAQRRLAAETLKRCPLCGAVNALTNDECFVCRWSGQFDRDPRRVEEGLDELLMRCPELVDAMLENAPPPRQRLWMRVCGWWRERFGLRDRLGY